ncbi:hypothetical protein FBQ96_13140 [Nitrospirales bacterium NOB]|nr:hypothetical protein [Nitrospirales bacterium NOB]
MNKRLYTLTRDLHLYLGLFIAPFVLVFSISVFFLVHAWSPGANEPAGPKRVVSDVALPADLENLGGRARVDALQTVLAEIGLTGEIGYVGHNVKGRTLRFPVVVPGRETSVEVDLAARTAAIGQRETGFSDALVALHKSPGPHLVDIRMNWLPMGVWRWLADGTVYLLFFISISGVYLWAVLRAERRTGLALIAAGAISFFGIIYAVIH